MVALLIIIGLTWTVKSCNEDMVPPKLVHHVVVGTVRKLSCGDVCAIALETDGNGELLRLVSGDAPQVWVGLHCEIYYHDGANWDPPVVIDRVHRID
jgi:hypothetical protein